MSLIIPNLYLGDVFDACNKNTLDKLKITHVLNCALELNSNKHGRVYVKIPLDDTNDQDLDGHLQLSFNFINDTLEKGGVILVHCQQGVSRSPSIVIYYLMMKKKMSFIEAANTVKRKRPIIRPNTGFSFQLWKRQLK